MSSTSLAYQSYGEAPQSSPSPRSVEAMAFARITRMLQNIPKAGPARYPSLVDALHMNKKLWSLLAYSVAQDENQLPAQLKARILSLALFTERHTKEVLDNEADLTALIEVNQSVLRGLKMKGAHQ
ncbi:flagellar biosynthesis regulator FlaF [Nereida sp. MMG025]|uniref:flagellar biosynthesis regulator FlaF n=1 Tax=Nereida sp. MMG025 TaxID=2909981 RepID=UPI001F428A16|nr:flagellar biosynthesis regulator FlaF [Nereida sp. MMG025]MCF6444689.1 flagellar biosynthesis regulator FlaF [Nereida sp. MMG025]